MTFDKFAWLKAVYAETVFTPGEKAVLAHIAVFNVLTGKDMLRIRQSTIADQCGISRPTVNGATGQAELLGYLTVSERHKPAPGRNTPAEWQLLIPEPCKESEHGLEPNHVKNLSEPCKAANSPTSENDTPNSSLNSSTKDNSSRGEVCDTAEGELVPMLEARIIPPSGFCSEHPHGEDPDCRRCWDRGKYRREWMHTPEGKAWLLREKTDEYRIQIQAKINANTEHVDSFRDRPSIFAVTNGARPQLESLPDIDSEAEEVEEVEEPNPDAPVCATDGCDKPATDGLFCGRCSTHRQLTKEPERDPAAGNSTGNGDLAATTTISSQEVAA